MHSVPWFPPGATFRCHYLAITSGPASICQLIPNPPMTYVLSCFRRSSSRVSRLPVYSQTTEPFGTALKTNRPRPAPGIREGRTSKGGQEGDDPRGDGTREASSLSVDVDDETMGGEWAAQEGCIYICRIGLLKERVLVPLRRLSASLTKYGDKKTHKCKGYRGAPKHEASQTA
eukprot:GHVQ01037989.1.p1 GENE.GHVQ01037989.1~~GHVQ01037989.1.p1  ORF type:complete len:174 (-),score=19.86 GHVQ01037989.1:580-1101(-)